MSATLPKSSQVRPPSAERRMKIFPAGSAKCATTMALLLATQIAGCTCPPTPPFAIRRTSSEPLSAGSAADQHAAPGAGPVIAPTAGALGRAPELAHPDDQRRIEQPAPHEVFDEF